MMMHRILFPAILIATAVLLSGCGIQPQPKAGVSVASVGTGGCYSLLPGAPDARSVLPRECSEAHDGQIFGYVRYRGSAKPETDSFDTELRGLCARQLVFVDQENLAAGAFAYTYVPPAPMQWRAGSRSVACVVYAADGSQLEDDYV